YRMVRGRRNARPCGRRQGGAFPGDAEGRLPDRSRLAPPWLAPLGESRPANLRLPIAALTPFRPAVLTSIPLFLLALPTPGFRRRPRARLGFFLSEVRLLSFTRSRLRWPEHPVLGGRAARSRLEGRARHRARRILFAFWRSLAACCGSTLPGRRLATTRAVLRSGSLLLGCSLAFPLLRRRGALCCWLLLNLAHGGLARLITVILAVQCLLLLNRRVAIAGITSLIGRQWRRLGHCIALPAVPAATPLLPVPPPMLAPAGWAIRLPAPEVDRRTDVVAHRNAQNEERHIFRVNSPPRPVVPGTGVPVIAFEHPVQAVIEEEIHAQSRRVIDRVARHPDQVRKQGDVDPDADFGNCRGRREEQHPQRDE